MLNIAETTSPVLLVAVRVYACKTVSDVMVKWFLSGLRVFSLAWQQPSSLLWCSAGSENGAEPPPGLRAPGLKRHACCHVAPEHSRRIRRGRRQQRRQRRRWWNQTSCGHLPIVQLQRGFSGPCQHGPLGAGQGLQEWLSELRQLRHPRLRPQLYHAAGQ